MNEARRLFDGRVGLFEAPRERFCLACNLLDDRALAIVGLGNAAASATSLAESLSAIEEKLAATGFARFSA